MSWSSVAPRTSSTPWYSGVASATTCSHAGSCDTGKNAPANRNIGIQTKRYSSAKLSSFAARTANAITGVANAAASSSENGSASSVAGPWASPSAQHHAR